MQYSFRRLEAAWTKAAWLTMCNLDERNLRSSVEIMLCRDLKSLKSSRIEGEGSQHFDASRLSLLRASWEMFQVEACEAWVGQARNLSSAW